MGWMIDRSCVLIPKDCKLFELRATYGAGDSRYFISAKSKKEAKEYFKSRFSWLKVTSVTEIEVDHEREYDKTHMFLMGRLTILEKYYSSSKKLLKTVAR